VFTRGSNSRRRCRRCRLNRQLLPLRRRCGE
jgi:hypothetical protein